MRARSLVVSLALGTLPGCRGTPVEQFPEDPDGLTVFSIDGAGTWRGPTDGTTMYGGPVLGQVEVTDPSRRRAILAAVNEAVRSHAKTDPRPACWMPRHVLRVSAGGRSLDAVVCFECRSYRVYPTGETSRSVGGGGITPAGQAAVNAVLVEAGVPVSPSFDELRAGTPEPAAIPAPAPARTARTR